MAAEIAVIKEYNEKGVLLWSRDYAGVCTRGASYDAAAAKLGGELAGYLSWLLEMEIDPCEVTPLVVQESLCALHVEDCDSDVIFDAELPALDTDAYLSLRAACMKSAESFLRLYRSIPDPDALLRERRQTFYGDIPATAREMYAHTDSVTAYYLGEIGVPHENAGDMAANRLRGFLALEGQPGSLDNRLYKGDGESWTLRKVLRRFIWHDRLHARALYRRAAALWGAENIDNSYGF